MKIKLIIVSPEVNPNEYDVTLPTKIGRGHEAKLKLVHPLVSRLHCELFADGEQVMIRDLDSLNGTFVDQQRIDEDTAVDSGATVMMGTVMFRLAYGKDADRLPPPPAAKMDKTAAADGTIRKESLHKIAKGKQEVGDEELWKDRVEDSTAVVAETGDPEDLALLDDDTEDREQPVAGEKTQPAPEPAAPAKQAVPATRPAAAKPAPASRPKDADEEELLVAPLEESAGEEPSGAAGDEKDDLDDFFKSIM